jgi:hypothetical protein
MTTVKELLDDLLNRQGISLPHVLDAHLGPGYRQRTDGIWSDRGEVGEHFAHLRTIVDHAEVTVLEELTDGQQYAERHLVDIAKRDGGRVLQEFYVFGELLPDGRFARLEEAALMLDGAEADRDIGSARA